MLETIRVIKSALSKIAHANQPKAGPATAQPVKKVYPIEKSRDGESWFLITEDQARDELSAAYKDIDGCIFLLIKGGTARAGGYQYRQRGK
jgi:hypothetical protein